MILLGCVLEKMDKSMHLTQKMVSLELHQVLRINPTQMQWIAWKLTLSSLTVVLPLMETFGGNKLAMIVQKVLLLGKTKFMMEVNHVRIQMQDSLHLHINAQLLIRIGKNQKEHQLVLFFLVDVDQILFP